MNGPPWDELRLAAPQLLPFFQHGAEGRLVVPRCRDCGLHYWPPRELCRRCRSQRSEWVEVAPSARLYSWTSSLASGPDEPTTAVIGVVALDLPDPVRMVGLVHVAAGSVDLIGQAVTGAFEPVEDGLPLLVWRAGTR